MNDLLKSIPWRQHAVNFLFAGLACVALGIAFFIHSNAQNNLLATQKRYQQQQNTNLEAERAAQVISEFLPVYREFQHKGIIGDPQRLQWLETLQKSSSTNLVPVMHFTLSPSTVATTTDTMYASDTLQLKVTPMQISFSLLHEGDFYRLFDALEKQSNGIFSSQDCVIDRNEGTFVENKSPDTVDTSNPDTLDSFKGHCNLLWFSLADLTKAWEATPQ